MKRNKDSVVKLDTVEIRRAVRSIYINSFRGDFDGDIPLSKIQISDRNYTTKINGKVVLRYDRHCHYINELDHQIAVYLYLRFVEEVLNFPEELRLTN